MTRRSPLSPRGEAIPRRELMGRRPAGKEIDDVAAAWVVRVDRAPLSSQHEAELAAWLAEDIRHRGAFARARAVFLHSDRTRALGPNFEPEKFKREEIRREGGPAGPAPSRRWVIGGGAALAATVAISVGLSLLTRSQAYATQRGEIRLVPLEDGSQLTLNTASKVSVRYTDDARNIQLLGGEALFDVAKNPSRPFVVATGNARIRAVGTSFTVRLMADQAIQVIVREGVVEVMSDNVGQAAPKTLRLTANQIATIRPGSLSAVRVDATMVARELTWREGILSLDDVPLSDAVERFARYSDTKILIDDPSIGAETITGLFAVNNPTGFASAAAESLSLKVRIAEGKIHLMR
ncbi:MAG: hypothetical protein B7Y99_07410 [Caulobacterales bacterium 32-69-10]|nr:MAG: hypothetical protein B7Y99_07410 [Caulobacterales bacterium 32-69-10]